jgi:hypothetical protein
MGHMITARLRFGETELLTVKFQTAMHSCLQVLATDTTAHVTLRLL